MNTPLHIFSALDTLVLERVDESRFRAISEPPKWCAGLLPDDDDDISLEATFPFLDHYVHESAEALAEGFKPPESEVWTQRTADGDEVHLQATALSVDGNDVVLVARGDTLHDAQQMLLQRGRQLRLIHEELAREVERRDVLMHCIVHDLQGPLNTILGTLSLLEESHLAPEIARLTTTAERAALRERDLIRDMLHVFAAETDEGVQSTAGADLIEVLGEAVMMIEPVAKAKGTAVQVELHCNSRDGALNVVAERSRLLRVISNLLDNAIRHARTRVSVNLWHDADTSDLSIEDDGPGVADDVKDRLFEKFARTSGTRGGTGLGLYFCRITVERFGGTIAYEQAESGGARFRVRLPRRP